MKLLKPTFLLLTTLFIFGFTCQKANPYVFTKGNQRFELVLPDGKDHLVYNVPTKAVIIYKNIEREEINLVAPGIQYISKDTLLFNASKPSVTNDTLYLFGGYGVNPYIRFRFQIPVREE